MDGKLSKRDFQYDDGRFHFCMTFLTARYSNFINAALLGKAAFVFVTFLSSPIEALNGIGRVDRPQHLRRELEEENAPIPG